MKWWNKDLGTGEVAQHLVRLFNRGEARGMFIAAESYTPPAVAQCRDALHQRVVVLCTLREIMYVLERGDDLREFLRGKINAAVLDKNPFHEPFRSYA